MGTDVSGIDESANGLADVLQVKRRVSEMLRAILEKDPDEWNLQIGGDEPGCIYVQGVQEDDGCIHLELVHASVAARPLGDQECEFLKQTGWQPPDDDIPNYWVFLEADEWTPPTTALFLAESLDRVYHAFHPRVTDGTVSVMPMDLAVEVMGDDEPMVAIRMPGDHEEWEPVWREGELEAVDSPEDDRLLESILAPEGPSRSEEAPGDEVRHLHESSGRQEAPNAADIDEGAAYLRTILERILELDPPWWALHLGGEDPGPMFIQGEHERDGALRLELVNQDVAGRPLGLREVIFLAEEDWSLPRGHVPHFYQFLEPNFWSPDEAAELLVRSMSAVYHVLDRGVVDASITVRPYDVANQLGIDDSWVIDVMDDEERGDTYLCWVPPQLEYLDNSADRARETPLSGEGAAVSIEDGRDGWNLSDVEELHQFCDRSNLPRVAVPSGVEALYRHSDFHVWSSSPTASPWFVYGFGEVGPEAGRFSEYVRPRPDPFFMFGVVGHGINSYGLGLVARGEFHAVAIQSGWGEAYRPASDTPDAAFMVSAWNGTLVNLEKCAPGGALLVIYSDFRDIRRCFQFHDDPGDDMWISSGDSADWLSDGLGPWWEPLPISADGAVIGWDSPRWPWPSSEPSDATRTLLQLLAQRHGRGQRG